MPKESSVTADYRIEPGMPADKAGIKVGDEILTTANGQDIPALAALVDMVNRKDQPERKSRSWSAQRPEAYV